MTIPDYQSIMLPLLKFASDEQDHSTREAIDHLAQFFNLTEEERKELLPSGRQAVFHNRVGWAQTYLKKAGLLKPTRRGHFMISERGIKALAENPSRVDIKFLAKFPEFVEFRKVFKKPTGKSGETEGDTSVQKNPEETLESAYQEMRADLAQELLDKVKNCSPAFFERLVVDLLVKMGYGGSLADAGRAIGKTGDEGIDGIIKEDRLGLDVIYIQAKRWENSVGRPEAQKFVGALEGRQAKKGILITASNFSKEARDYVSRVNSKVVLIDGQQLAQFMIDFDIGVTKAASYEIKSIDSDYFEEE